MPCGFGFTNRIIGFMAQQSCAGRHSMLFSLAGFCGQDFADRFLMSGFRWQLFIGKDSLVDFYVLFLRRAHSPDSHPLDSNPLPTDYEARALTNAPSGTRFSLLRLGYQVIAYRYSLLRLRW